MKVSGPGRGEAIPEQPPKGGTANSAVIGNSVFFVPAECGAMLRIQVVTRFLTKSS